MAGFLCAQTAVIKLTEEGPVRLAALGRLTSAYTIGGVLGPYIGGQLGSSGNYTFGAQSACAGSILAILLVFLLPSHLDAEDEDEDEEEDEGEEDEEEDEDDEENRPTKAVPAAVSAAAAATAKNGPSLTLAKVGQLCGWMVTHCGFDPATGTRYAAALVLGLGSGLGLGRVRVRVRVRVRARVSYGHTLP